MDIWVVMAGPGERQVMNMVDGVWHGGGLEALQ